MISYSSVPSRTQAQRPTILSPRFFRARQAQRQGMEKRNIVVRLITTKACIRGGHTPTLRPKHCYRYNRLEHLWTPSYYSRDFSLIPVWLHVTVSPRPLLPKPPLYPSSQLSSCRVIRSWRESGHTRASSLFLFNPPIHPPTQKANKLFRPFQGFHISQPHQPDSLL